MSYRMLTHNLVRVLKLLSGTGPMTKLESTEVLTNSAASTTKPGTTTSLSKTVITSMYFVKTHNEKYTDVTKAKEGLRRLLKYNFDSLLVGDGVSILAHAKQQVEQLLAVP